jgi:endoglucanase
MDDDQFAFFQRLVEVTGPSGYEAGAQRIWRERVQEFVAEVRVDALGNNIAVLNPSGRPRVMLDAHIDEIGFLVRHIDDNGFIYFAPIGGFDATTLPGNRVRIIGKNGPVLGVIGRKPPHVLDQDERKKAPELKSMWIDIGAADRKEALELVGVGDAGGRAHGVQRLQGSIVTSAALDDRLGCYIMAETIRALCDDPPKAALLAASSVQEEIGLRGARVSAYTIDAEIGVALEVTWTTDHPQMSKSELGDSRVGAGPVIFRGANINPRIFDRLAAAARTEGMDYQVDVYAAGSPTDANAMQMSRSGMAVGILSIPTRYLHTASEVCSLDDIDAAVRTLTRFMRDLDESVSLIP